MWCCSSRFFAWWIGVPWGRGSVFDAKLLLFPLRHSSSIWVLNAVCVVGLFFYQSKLKAKSTWEVRKIFYFEEARPTSWLELGENGTSRPAFIIHHSSCIRIRINLMRVTFPPTIEKNNGPNPLQFDLPLLFSPCEITTEIYASLGKAGAPGCYARIFNPVPSTCLLSNP